MRSLVHLVVECGIHGQSNFNPANLQCCCGTEAQTGFVPTSVHGFRCRHLLDIEISILNGVLAPKYRVSVCFVRGHLSQPIRQIICCRAVPLYLNLHWNSQIHVYGSQVWSNLTSFHHCAELRFSNAQGCKALKSGSRFYSVIANLKAPIPSCFFSRLVVFGNSNAALGFPTRCRAARLSGIKSISRCGASLLEAAYHHSIGALLALNMCQSSKAALSQSCHIAVFVNPVARSSTDEFFIFVRCPLGARACGASGELAAQA